MYRSRRKVQSYGLRRDKALETLADLGLRLLERSESLYREAEKTEPNKAYLYDSWATAYYWRGQYPEAWAMVAKARAAGGKSTEKFLSLLRAKLAEPMQ